MASPAIFSDSPPDRDDQVPVGSGLTGDMGDKQASPMPAKQDQMRAFIGRIKKWTTEIEDFSRQFPAFAEFGRKMKEAAIEGMTRVASQMQSQPGGGAQPPV